MFRSHDVARDKKKNALPIKGALRSGEIASEMDA